MEAGVVMLYFSSNSTFLSVSSCCWCCYVVFFFKFDVSKCFFLSECWTTFRLKVSEDNLRVRTRRSGRFFVGFFFFFFVILFSDMYSERRHVLL